MNEQLNFPAMNETLNFLLSLAPFLLPTLPANIARAASFALSLEQDRAGFAEGMNAAAAVLQSANAEKRDLTDAEIATLGASHPANQAKLDAAVARVTG